MGKTIAAYILSTATARLEIVEYDTNSGPLPKVRRKVNLLGGANLPAKTLVTPRGVVTPVSAEDLEFLVGNVEFQRLKKQGFVEIIRGKGEDDLDAALAGMEAKDRSAPKTAKDFEKPPTASVAA